MKARKKPVVVNVERVTERTIVETAHGPVPADAGDYILTNPETGDKWPIRATIFADTYEVVDQ